MREPIEKFLKKFSSKLQRIEKTRIQLHQTKLINQISTISKVVFFLQD